MPELTVRTLSRSGDAAGVHVVSDMAAARDILEDTATFRMASMSEFVPRMSSSFFLAAHMTDAEGAARCHAEMAAYLAPNRLPELSQALRGTAEDVVVSLPTGKPFDIEQDCLHPYGLRVASVLSGLPLEEVSTLAAATTVAARTERTDSSGRSSALLTWAWNRLHVFIAEGRPSAGPGLSAFAIGRNNLTSREMALLTMPLIEMAAYDRSTAIARISFGEIRGDNANLAEIIAAGGIRDLLWRAAALIDGLYVTRVALKDSYIAGTPIRVGDRVIIDVTAANRASVSNKSDTGTAAGHLAFGWGRHACIARELSIQINSAILEALAGRGRLEPSGGPGNRTWSIMQGSEAARN